MRAFLWYISLILYENSKNRILLIKSWGNSSIHLFHDEVYKNEISRSLPSVSFSIICFHCRLYRDEKMLDELKPEITNLRIDYLCQPLLLFMPRSQVDNLHIQLQSFLEKKYLSEFLVAPLWLRRSCVQRTFRKKTKRKKTCVVICSSHLWR